MKDDSCSLIVLCVLMVMRLKVQYNRLMMLFIRYEPSEAKLNCTKQPQDNTYHIHSLFHSKHLLI